jgi:hypothetical protein
VLQDEKAVSLIEKNAEHNISASININILTLKDGPSLIFSDVKITDCMSNFLHSYN